MEASSTRTTRGIPLSSSQQTLPARTKVSGTFRVVIVGPVVSDEDHPNVRVELSTTFVISERDCGSPHGMKEFIDNLRSVYVLGRLSDSPFNVNRSLSRHFKTVEDYEAAVDDMYVFCTWFHEQ